MDLDCIENSNLRYSEQAKSLIPRLKGLNMADFEVWFLEKSAQTVIGSGTFTEYFMYLDKQKKLNGNKL